MKSRLRLISSLMYLSFALFSCNKEQGCTDISACNFSPTAEENDGTCYKPGDDCNDENTNTIYDIYNENCECLGILMSLGCTDNSACNYNENANTDDGSCGFPGDECDDNIANTFNDSYTSNCECIGIVIYPGCTNNNACNYNENANTDDNTCYFPGDSCNDGDDSSVEDVWDVNCECHGQECDINDEGNPTIIFGLNTDDYPENNQVSITYNTPSELYLLSGWQTPTEANSENVWEYSAGNQVGPGGEWAIYIIDQGPPYDELIGAYYFVGCYINGNPYNDYLIPYTNWVNEAPSPGSSSYEYHVFSIN